MPRRDRSLVDGDASIAVNVDSATLALLETESAKAGLSVTEYLREAAVSRARRSRAATPSVREEARALRAQSQQACRRAHELLVASDALSRQRESVFRTTPDWSEMHPLYDGGCCTRVMSLGGWLATCVQANDRSRVGAAVREAIAQGSVLEIEYGVIRSDGLIGTAHFRAVPLVGDDGEVTEWLAAAREDVQESVPERRAQAAVAAI